MLKTHLPRRILSVLFVFATISTVLGAGPRNPYTESELEVAVPMGIPGVRAWADAPLSVLQIQVANLLSFNQAHQFSILALSGGGEHGSFGAGLLSGWSESGQRPVLWNMGAIAASGRPRALELFRKVLLASASVPGLFDPVFIDAEAGGRRFQEMHVDGGTTLQLLAIPLKLAAAGRLAAAHNLSGQLYIVINNRLDPWFEMTKAKTLSIMGRAFNSLVKSDIYDTILGAYLFSEKQGFRFNLTYIPNTFRSVTRELIDPTYMASLFELGRARGHLGGDWEHLPPRLYR